MAARTARKMWQGTDPAPPDHPYLIKKKIGAHNLRIDAGGKLLVPMQDIEGQLWNLQRIDREGNKRFLPGGRTDGLFFNTGPKPDPTGIIDIVEGMATGISINESSGHIVFAAMSAGNLPNVGNALRAKYPEARIAFFAEQDGINEKTGFRMGIVKAHEAAATVVGGQLPGPVPRHPDRSRVSEWVII